ncbi:MAG: ABC transporter substrate-binding protein [Myxococcota bacterium]
MWRHPLALVLSLAILATGLAVALPGWLGGESPEASRTKSARLVSLTPAVTETLVALGAGDRLVGRSDFCPTAGLSEGVPMVGTTLQPNFEGLVKVRPDHILATEAGSLADDALRQIAPTTALPWRTVPEMVESVRTLGQLVGKEGASDTLALRLQTEVLKDPPKGAPRLLLLLGYGALTDGQLWFIKPGSLHDQVLRAAGARNAISEAVDGAPSMPLEQLLTLDPDLIIVLSPKDAMTDAEKGALIEPLTRMTTLRASREARLAVMVRANVLGEGPGLLDLVAPLREMITGLMAKPVRP